MWIPPELKRKSRRLRRLSTFPEHRLWNELRDRRLAGLKFRRQHVIGAYVVDFVCMSARLVVEVDGESHVGRVVQDERRRRCLEQLGFQVLQVTNDDVMRNLEGVVQVIEQAARARTPPPSPPGRGPG